MARSITLTFGDKDYIVAQLRSRPSAAWRGKLNEQIGGIVGALTGAEKIELADMSKIADLVSKFSHLLIGSVDIVADLMFDYSPALADHKDEILDEAFDDELIDGFVAILKLAFPLERMQNLLRGRS